jgi:hypothetical protein
MRAIACLLVLAALVAAALSANAPTRADLPRSASAVAPAATIDIGGLFGDENEPDENEPDEGEGGRAADDASGSSGVSVPAVLFLVVLAAVGGGWTALRVRRLWLRLRGWGRGLWARL